MKDLKGHPSLLTSFYLRASPSTFYLKISNLLNHSEACVINYLKKKMYKIEEEKKHTQKQDRQLWLQAFVQNY